MKSPKKQKATAQETALSEVSSAQWNDYKERFRPAEAALAKNAELTKGERAQVKGEVAADTAAAFKGIDRSTIASGGVAGADVNSGKTKLSLAGDATAAGVAKGVGQSIAETGAELDSQGRQIQIAGFGRGVAHQATANMSRGAHRATNLALAASQAKFERNAARLDAVATVAGAAAKKYSTVQEAKSRGRLDSIIAEGSGMDAQGVSIPGFDFNKGQYDPFKNSPNPFAGMFPEV